MSEWQTYWTNIASIRFRIWHTITPQDGRWRCTSWTQNNVYEYNLTGWDRLPHLTSISAWWKSSRRRDQRAQTSVLLDDNIPGRLRGFVLDYVMETMNITVNYSRYSDERVPIKVVTGVTPDITEYLDFHIYGWVFFDTEGGLGTNEIGRWSGVSHRIRPMMTY